VSDSDNDFDEVEIVVKDSGGTEVASATRDQASGTREFTGLDSGNYEIMLTARDTNGNANSETRSDSVSNPGDGGSGGSNPGSGNGSGN